MADEEEGLELDGEDGGFQDYEADEEAATGSGAEGEEGSASGRRDGGRKTGSAASSKGRGGSRSGAGKGKRYCRGCGQFKKHDEFAVNGQPLCIPDKKALDNLKAVARRQSQTEWLEKLIYDDARLQTLLAEYHFRCPEN